MRRQFWQRVIALLVLALAVSAGVQIIPALPSGDATLIRAILTLVWAAVSLILMGGMRRIALAGLRSEPSERRAVVHLGVQVMLAILAVVSVLVLASVWRFSFTGLALGGALTGIVVGLAAQSTLGNPIAGAMLLALRPFRVGEWATIRIAGWDCTGQIEEINFFYTVLRDGGLRRVIPNSLVAGSAANVTETQIQSAQTIALPYRVTPEQVKGILKPYRSAAVVDLRVDGYAMRVEWLSEEGVGERLEAIARLIAAAG